MTVFPTTVGDSSKALVNISNYPRYQHRVLKYYHAITSKLKIVRLATGSCTDGRKLLRDVRVD